MKIQVSGTVTTFHVSVKRDQDTEENAYEVVAKVESAVKDAFSSAQSYGGSILGRDEASDQWKIPAAGGKVLKAQLGLVNTLRATTLDKIFNAIAAAGAAV